nr:uncharacterized protein LOC124498095 [Dermatophagoides farinae]
MEPPFDFTCDSVILDGYAKNLLNSSTITVHETFEDVVGVDLEIVNKKNPCKCDELKKEKLLLAKKLEECHQECQEYRNLIEEKDKINEDLRHKIETIENKIEITKQRDPERVAIQDKIYVQKFGKKFYDYFLNDFDLYRYKFPNFNDSIMKLLNDKDQQVNTGDMNGQLNNMIDDIIEDLKSKLLLADIGADKISDKRLLLNSISGTIFRFIFKKLMSRFPLLEQKYNSLNLNLEKNLLQCLMDKVCNKKNGTRKLYRKKYKNLPDLH